MPPGSDVVQQSPAPGFSSTGNRQGVKSANGDLRRTRTLLAQVFLLLGPQLRPDVFSFLAIPARSCSNRPAAALSV
jgi:hypothetical protein